MPNVVKPSDSSALFDLTGQVAIVTGASSGFGVRFCEVLSNAGANVVMAARREDRLAALAARLPNSLPIRCDVTDDEQLRRLVDESIDRFGKVDILVNNAGTSDSPVKAEDEDPALFRAVVDVNLNACFVLSALVAKPMIERGEGGSIINIASIHSIVGSPSIHQAAYVASKAGLTGLTRDLAAQWARHRIRVNAIAPGYFETELTHDLFVGDTAEGGQRYIERGALMRRPGNEGELDGVLLLLASSASSYITGETIAVDGGWTAK
ncbi:MAG: SDR family oxidoreductase [Actinobacteria bacterium]|nr:SDR family oxidoreductase [Actinomycetota bacterium]